MATSSQFRYSGDIQGNDINHNLPVRFDADGSGCVGITQPDSAHRKGLDRVLLTSQQVVALFEFCEGKRVGITGALKPNYRRTLKCEECSVEVNRDPWPDGWTQSGESRWGRDYDSSRLASHCPVHSEERQ